MTLALSGGLPWGGPLAGADYLIDRLGDTFACQSCGSPEPVRVGDGVCSDCSDHWPRCAACRRWLLGDDAADALMVDDERGDLALLCARCVERAA